jgi:hypothetical protein
MAQTQNAFSRMLKNNLKRENFRFNFAPCKQLNRGDEPSLRLSPRIVFLAPRIAIEWHLDDE